MKKKSLESFLMEDDQILLLREIYSSIQHDGPIKFSKIVSRQHIDKEAALKSQQVSLTKNGNFPSNNNPDPETKHIKQLVWQFLRINPVYKKSYDYLNALTAKQDEDLAESWEAFANSFGLSEPVDYKLTSLPDDTRFNPIRSYYSSAETFFSKIPTATKFADLASGMVSYNLGLPNNIENPLQVKPLTIVINPYFDTKKINEDLNETLLKYREDVLLQLSRAFNKHYKNQKLEKDPLTAPPRLNILQSKKSILVRYLYWYRIEELGLFDKKTYKKLGIEKPAIKELTKIYDENILKIFNKSIDHPNDFRAMSSNTYWIAWFAPWIFLSFD